MSLHVNSEPMGDKKRGRTTDGQRAVVPGGKKKHKNTPPHVGYKIEIQRAAKVGDIQSAFESYDRAMVEGVKLPSDCFITLLFLASGGDTWEDQVGSAGNLMQRAALGRCDEILDSMKTLGYEPIEMCYTALARRDAIMGLSLIHI